MPLFASSLLFGAFILGSIIGSFLNVCIYRIPAGLSVVSPRSRCPYCEAPISWYQNVPIFSYLALRGRCATCGIKISPRYALVEMFTGLLFSLVLWSFGLSPATLIYWVFCAGLVVITFIDLDHQIIPDVISLPGILVGFVGSFFVPWLGWFDSLLGVLLGGGLLLTIAWGYMFLTKREGMGGGDIKLLAMIGAFMGWKAIFPVIFISSMVGTLVGVPLMLFKRGDVRLAIPFGPFLSLGALVFLLWGPLLVRWYFSLWQ